MNKLLTLILAFFILIELLLGQENTKINKIQKEDANIVRNIVFVSQGMYIPLTVLYCPYGYWEFGNVRYGFHNYDNIQYLSHHKYGWKSNGMTIETPSRYVYDTINIDTIFSLYENLMCRAIDSSVTQYYDFDTMSNITNKKNISKILINDFEYTHLLKNIVDYDNNENENIKVLYSSISPNGYLDYFYLVNLRLMQDSILMTSSIINTINLLDINLEIKDSIVITGREYKRLAKRISKTTFSKIVDCGNCRQEPFDQEVYMIDFSSEYLHSTFFLCDLLKTNKKEKKTMDYLKGLKHHVSYLNRKYFINKNSGFVR